MANPSMTTSNECYGMSLPEASKRASFVSPEGNSEQVPSGCGALPGMDEKSQGDLSFLYSRESDRFGEGTSFSDSALSQVFRLKESDSMSKRRKNSVFVKQLHKSSDAPRQSRIVPKEEIDEIVSKYKNNPKEQKPLYATTANEYGRKKPTAATIATVAFNRTQKFSHSFNKTMYRDEGLTASMSRSNIHDSLTPLW